METMVSWIFEIILSFVPLLFIIFYILIFKGNTKNRIMLLINDGQLFLLSSSISTSAIMKLLFTKKIISSFDKIIIASLTISIMFSIFFFAFLFFIKEYNVKIEDYKINLQLIKISVFLIIFSTIVSFIVCLISLT